MKPPALEAAVGKGCNPHQIANAFAHRPEVRDLGWWMYTQRNRIRSNLNRTVRRIERRREERAQLVAVDWDEN
jgi:hypothetical protein